MELTVKKERSAYYDNIKGVLIALVVLGHLLTPDLLSNRYLYVAIMCFHMPAFVFISGMLTKDAGKSSANVLKQNLLIYLVFALLYAFYNTAEGFSSFSFSRVAEVFVRPRFAMWYLYSIITWRLLLPAVKKMKFVLPILIVVAILAGAQQRIDVVCSLSRTLVFFPFFYAGHMYGQQLLEKLAKLKKIWLVLLLAAALAAVMAFYVIIEPPLRLFMHNGPYSNMGVGFIKGGAARLFSLVIAAAMSIAVFGLIPKKKGIFTALGRNSLPIFVIHQQLTMFVEYKMLLPWVKAGMDPYVHLLLCFLFSALILLILGNNYVDKGFRWVFGKLSGLLFRSENKPSEPKTGAA